MTETREQCIERVRDDIRQILARAQQPNVTRSAKVFAAGQCKAIARDLPELKSFGYRAARKLVRK